jgi:hypothetical protein
MLFASCPDHFLPQFPAALGQVQVSVDLKGRAWITANKFGDHPHRSRHYEADALNPTAPASTRLLSMDQFRSRQKHIALVAENGRNLF